MSIAAVVVAVTAWYGVGEYLMHRTGPDIEFVLPDGFQGKFTIVIDRKKGEKPVEKAGKVVVRIGKDGVATIRDDRFFTVWHKHAARYENGTRIPTDTDDRTRPEDTAARFVTGSNEEMVYLVGTAKEAWDVHENR